MTAGWWAGREEQRTSNMVYMFVTREVSQLSGWLKAEPCRGSQAGHTVRGGLRAGRREVARGRGVRAACTGEGETADWGAGAQGAQRT